MENATPKKVNVPNNTLDCDGLVVDVAVVVLVPPAMEADGVFFTKCRASSRATCGGILDVMVFRSSSLSYLLPVNVLDAFLRFIPGHENY